MALTSLAQWSDLDARQITVPSGVDANLVLSQISDSVRDAAGCSITSDTSTITIPVTTGDAYLDLPAGPVTAVASVVDSTATPVTGWTKIGDALYLPGGWNPPQEVTVEYTHGLAAVPGDIIDLVCSLAGMVFFQIDADTYGTQNQIQAERLGDYSITYDHGTGVASTSKSPSPMAIPDSTRDWLKGRFGNAAGVVGMRR